MGDLDKPKLVFFFDEAHLLFDGASKAFLDQVEQVVRLIRSKGVGVFFVTQSPKDVPADVLGQLGHRVQHALRAFTPDDEKALQGGGAHVPEDRRSTTSRRRSRRSASARRWSRCSSPNGVADAAVRDAADPAVVAHGAAHRRRAAAAARVVEQVRKYAQAVDRESAREMLSARASAAAEQEEDAAEDDREPERDERRRGAAAR